LKRNELQKKAIEQLENRQVKLEDIGKIVLELETDDGLYGIDEVIPLSIVNVYGTIGLTNFGYLDKKKSGVIKDLDEGKKNRVNTFLDDIVAGLASAAAARIGYSEE